MSMILRSLPVALLALLLLASGPARADDMKDMQGNWKVTGGEVGKTPLPKGMEVIIEKDKFTLKEGSKQEVVHFVLDDTAKPHGVEFFKMGDKKEKVWHGIYEFDGKELKFCWGPAGKSRPTDFKPRKNSEDRYYILKKK
jgi:uncharacterized protein (TIGR03067 family)